MSLRSIQGYEQRINCIDSARLDTLLNLCIALNCKFDDILENEENISKLHKICNSSKHIKSIELDSNNEEKISDKYTEEQLLYIKFFDNENLNKLTQDQKDGIKYELRNFSHSWQEILYLRYIKKFTLEQISKSRGISAERVRQISAKAIEQLKKLEVSKNVIYGFKTCQKMILLEEKNRSFFDISIDKLNLSGRAYNCLMRVGLTQIGSVILSQDKLLDIDQVGKRTVDEIMDKIKNFFEEYNSTNI